MHVEPACTPYIVQAHTFIKLRPFSRALHALAYDCMWDVCLTPCNCHAHSPAYVGKWEGEGPNTTCSKTLAEHERVRCRALPAHARHAAGVQRRGLDKRQVGISFFGGTFVFLLLSFRCAWVKSPACLVTHARPYHHHNRRAHIRTHTYTPTRSPQ